MVREKKESKKFIYFMAVLAILDMAPYFVWSQINPLLYKVYTLCLLLATVLLTFKNLRITVVVGSKEPVTGKNKISLGLLLSSLLVVLLFFYEVYGSGVVTKTMQPFNISLLCIHIGLMLFCWLEPETLREIFLIAKKIFAITLIPAIFVFILLQLRVPLPYTMLSADSGKELTSQSYRLYLGVATMLESYGEWQNRLCGIYREPGFVGTVGALFLIGDRLNLKKWDNLVILIALLCTFSLAFVMLLAIAYLLYMVYRLKDSNKAIGGVVAILGLICAYFVFMSIPFSETSGLGELQARLVFTDEGLSGDNRIANSEYAEAAYEKFLKSDMKTVLLGHGVSLEMIPGTEINIWQNVCSYKEFVYYFGFLGLAILVAWLWCTVKSKFNFAQGIAKWHVTVLLLVFVFSIYQRYSVVNFHYLTILLGGCANCALFKEEN